MAVFDAPSARKQPTRRKDYSFDFRLMHLYFGCMFVLLIFGSAFTVGQELAVAAILVTLLAALSLQRPHSLNWRWPGVKPKGIPGAASILGVSVVLEVVANRIGPRSDPRFLP